MDLSILSRRSPSPNKEDTSDITHRLRGNDREQNQAIDPKVLRRATLKIDVYLIPIVGMFCASFLQLVSHSTANCLPHVQISFRSW